jgi:hypothetical protein
VKSPVGKQLSENAAFLVTPQKLSFSPTALRHRMPPRPPDREADYRKSPYPRKESIRDNQCQNKKNRPALDH